MNQSIINNLKKVLPISLLLNIIFLGNAHAQVGIGTTSPHSSAILEISSTTQGLLLPRMDSVQRDAIEAPTAGLMIYNNGSGSYSLEISNGVTWSKLRNKISSSVTSGTEPEGGIASIGTATPNGNAVLDLSSSNKGFLPPRLTSSQRDLMVNPPQGLLIYNKETNTLEFVSNGNKWVAIGKGGVTTPAVTTTGTSLSDAGNIGIGVTSPNPYAALELASTTKGFLPPRLTDAQRDNLDTAGGEGLMIYNSSFGALQFYDGNDWIVASGPCQGEPSIFLFNGDFYSPKALSNGTCWLDRNLGADTTNQTGSLGGFLFQWGRGTDGHQERNSLTTISDSISAIPIPGTNRFITNTSTGTYQDWLSPQLDTLWATEASANNPCPTGYKVPSRAELLSGISNSLGLLPSGVRLSSGTVNDAAFAYWTREASGNQAYMIYLDFFGAGYTYTGYNRANGMPIRCIKD